MELHPVVALINGLFMWLTDLGLVWAAAHWGAAYAVRLGQLWLAALYLAGRLALTTLLLLGCAVLATVAGLLPFAVTAILVNIRSQKFIELTHNVGLLAAALLIGLLVFAVLFRRVIVGAVRMALVEFAWFDRLADDEFAPRLKGARPWAMPLDPRARP
jgi:hypothetical protein